MDDHSDSDDEPSKDILFLWACGFELAIGLLGLVLGWILGADARAYLERVDQLTWDSLLGDVGLGVLAAVPMVGAIWLLMKLPWEAVAAIKRLGEDPTMQSILSLDRSELTVISICAGIGEELAFRGFLLPGLIVAGGALTGNDYFQAGMTFAKADPGLLVIAVVISSVAFGLLHPISKFYIVVAALMGVYFAALLVLTDSLLVPIVAHAAYNATQFWQAKQEQ